MTDFERVKEKIDLLTIIENETGFTMKRSHLEECPFCGGHECFTVDREKGVYKCFQCPEAGDIFTFYEKYHNIDKAEALRRAAHAAGVELTEIKRREIKLTTKERIFLEAAEYYHTQYKENGARAYFVEKRGHRESALEHMHVGWTNGALTDYLRTKGFTDADIKASGLAKERTINNQNVLADLFFKGLAIFPHYDDGKVLHFTIKDPNKKYAYQLPNEARSREWRFYNQAALAKYNEIILVEGENDVLSVMDASINHVMGLIGQPADYQIRALKQRCRGKHLYLWLDNDEDPDKPDTKGKGYIRKICRELRDEKFNVRIFVYPESSKDPDDYLRGFEGDKRKEIKRLQAEAVDYITWEIGEIARLEGLDKRLMALKDRKIFTALTDMVEAERLAFMEKIERLGFTKSAIETQLELSLDLLVDLDEYFENLQNKRDSDPNRVAGIIYKHLNSQGQFFRDREGKVYLFYKHLIYEIGNNRPFNALMKKTTRLLPTKEPGRSVWESLASEAYNYGRQIDLSSWICTDRATDSIFVNLNSPNNVILKITAQGIEEIQNGLNKEGILLRSSRKILPLNYMPDVSIREGMSALKEHIFDNLPCEPEQRYLVLCWFITAFLLDYAPYMALMKFSGPTSSGKTTAAKLLSLLIYGNEHLGDPSTAAMYAVSSQNPLLIVDNLESEDITKSGLKFLLLSATKGGKEKRTAGTETDTTEEMPKALVLITAIEPFTKAELINRTYDVEYGNKWKGEDFIEDEVIRQIVKKRDLILSSIIRFISKEILPNLEKRRDFITILKKVHRGHSKNRTDEFLAMMMLILEKIVRYIPYFNEDDPEYGCENELGWGDELIRKAWIEYQDAKAKETETMSSNIVKLLDGLVKEYLMKMREVTETEYSAEHGEVFVYTHPEYGLEIAKTRAEVKRDDTTGDDYTRTLLEFVAEPQSIVFAFDRFCKNNGLRNPYVNASVFGERLKNDRALLEKTGWELVARENVAPYFKVIRGRRFWKFRKTIIR